ncbi:hypothetical protein HMPREF1544_02673 [Mucor circinelloides 1006PhL]|uniref:Uncharacterized protein n=1 Tax=Mucor circinelloides f. circinelloides (strain 1006PhL) TaxID=1220926 RepID=S2KDQ9_MUCC1|nr:hypothetical protein HMPREF1544_02673 [Mucor circinelloides 1006PhL]
MTPHFANYGYEPHFSLNLPHTTKGNSPALDRAKLLKELHEEVPVSKSVIKFGCYQEMSKHKDQLPNWTISDSDHIKY